VLHTLLAGIPVVTFSHVTGPVLKLIEAEGDLQK
jgi:hypothetical protein